MARTVNTLTALAAACLLGAVQSWKYEGHYMVARMAYDILVVQSPAALK